ncbi:uncharacterized protein LOC141905712 [Tubulanus polymorphus]|uniref:uncharacterized protein LOC141905712 n=1 Tax=Tubulanus polymorphus TaxID=672921 RepID=UPI003DA48BE4
MWIPTPGIRFRILSSYMNKMFQAGSGYTAVGGVQLGECTTRNDYNYYDGSWWTLKPSRESNYYLIINLTENKRLYVSSDRDNECGMISTEYYQYSDQLWKFQPKDDINFQLISHDKRRKLYFRDHSNHIGLCGSNVFPYDDQFFHFMFEEPTISAVNFKLNSARFLHRPPKLITQRTFRNGTSLTQEDKLTVTYTQSKSHRWSYTGGFKFSIGMSTRFKASIPLFAELDATLSMGFETDHHWTTEDVTTESREMTFEFPVKVPAGKLITAKVMLHEQEAEVPYEMIFSFKGSGHMVTTSGIWRGVDSMHCYRDVSEEDI